MGATTPLSFEEFERQVYAVGPPPFRINETYWASEASILPTLLFICAAGSILHQEGTACMEELKKYKLMHGHNHFKDGQFVEPGTVIEMTEEQYGRLKDKFVPEGEPLPPPPPREETDDEGEEDETEDDDDNDGADDGEEDSDDDEDKEEDLTDEEKAALEAEGDESPIAIRRREKEAKKKAKAEKKAAKAAKKSKK